MTITVRLLRDRARGFLGWSVGVVALVLLTVAFYPSIKDQGQALNDLLNHLPDAFKSAFNYDARIPLTSPAGYLNARLFSILAPVLTLIFAIGLGAQAIGGLEEAQRMEPLLANPVTRTRVALERYGAGVVLLTGLVTVLTVAIVALSAPFGVLEGIQLWGLVGACMAVACLALLFGSVAYAVGAATGRRGPAIATATAIAVTGYLIQSLQPLTHLLDPARFVNPWHWYSERNMLAYGVTLEAIVAPLGISAVLVLLGVLVFRRRDLH
jgi:beta-exotoxin I transport system permease protein